MNRTTRVIGHMVTRNEMGRYLEQSLAWLRTIVDDLVVYDDLSTDGTFDYLRDLSGIRAGQRHASELGFEHDESMFRQAAWRYMETQARPMAQDWILCVDADEFLLADADGINVRDALSDVIEEATTIGEQAVSFDVAECFGTAGGCPLIRTDGYWGTIQACRLVHWRPGGQFNPRREGGGSVPSSWISWRVIAEDLHLLHLGYTRPEDRKARFMRYSAGRGHNPRHIASITQQGRLARWSGQVVPVDLP